MADSVSIWCWAKYATFECCPRTISPPIRSISPASVRNSVLLAGAIDAEDAGLAFPDKRVDPIPSTIAWPS